MPFQSRAQQRFAFGTGQPWAEEWARATKRKKGGFKKLPERVHKAETPQERFQRHQRLVQSGIMLGAAIPAIAALRAGRAASTAGFRGEKELQALHSSRQLAHGATATALGGIGGAIGVLPTPARLLHPKQRPIPRRILTAPNPKRFKKPSKLAAGRRVYATGIRPKPQYTTNTIQKQEPRTNRNRRTLQGATMLAGGGLGLTTAANVRNIADRYAARVERPHKARIAAAEQHLAQVKAAPKPGPPAGGTWASLARKWPVAGQHGQRFSPGAVKRKVQAPHAARIREAQGAVHEARAGLRAAGAGVARGRFKIAAATVYGGTAVGVPLLWAGGRRLAHPNPPDHVHKVVYRRDVDAATVGGLGGAAAYQGVSYGTKPIEHALYNRRQTEAHHRLVRQHRQAVGMPKTHSAVSNKWKEFFRGYPESVPGARFKRTLGYTHAGKTGLAVQGAVIGAGALGTAAYMRHRRAQQPVVKVTFERQPGQVTVRRGPADQPTRRMREATALGAAGGAVGGAFLGRAKWGLKGQRWVPVAGVPAGIVIARHRQRRKEQRQAQLDQTPVGLPVVAAKADNLRRHAGTLGVAAGGGLAGAAYQAGGYKLRLRQSARDEPTRGPVHSPNMEYMSRRNVNPRAYREEIGRHLHRHGIHEGYTPRYTGGRALGYVTGQGPRQHIEAARTWPTKFRDVRVPGATTRRVLGYTHGGKTGLAVGAATIGAGALAGHGVARRVERRR